MSKTKVAVGIAPSNLLQNDVMTLGEALVKQWKIPSAQPINLKFGSYRKQMRIIPAEKQNGIKLNPFVGEILGFSPKTKHYMHLKYTAHNTTLELGPLIGILVSREYPDTPDNPFGAITQFCMEAAEACRLQGGQVFFFTPNQLNHEVSYVQGWTYNGGSWRKHPMPLPHVIYNRLTTRKLENLPSVQKFLQNAVQHHNTAVFNEKFLNKTEVFSALSSNRSVNRYLPESKPLKSLATLKNMSSKYNTLFIKPVTGSMGRGIIRISHDQQTSYHAQHATSSGSRKQQFNSLQKLYANLFSKKRSRYQVQQGLQLIEIQKRPVDFRALVQKNKLGEWSVTSVVARIAGNQHFVSNLARGGTLCKVEEAISRSNMLGRSSGYEIASRLRQAALLIAQGIEDGIEGHFGELGIDFALDRSGRIWLLEVNSKPSKNDNTPWQEGKIRPSVKKLLAYSKYLSKF
ncbi:YheC/YheD family protein [Paenibacillus sp. GXUN7292]|uniref:YheC/YheD family endospore coat-associated protein n=1 Tax=Paenibacillus sp. GXUN7292 TaxID=3422499 RepID=UPI003D7DA59E